MKKPVDWNELTGCPQLDSRVGTVRQCCAFLRAGEGFVTSKDSPWFYWLQRDARRYGHEDLCTLHRKICGDEDAGQFRILPVRIRHNPQTATEFCRPETIIPSLEALGSMLQVQEAEVLYIGSLMVAGLCQIHPFRDGNGRAARLWASLWLVQNDYPPFSVPAQDRAEYFTTLAHFSTYARLRPFSEFFIRRVGEEGEALAASTPKSSSCRREGSTEREVF